MPSPTSSPTLPSLPRSTSHSPLPADPNALPLVRIAIIGAGASGLAQLKQALDAFARPSVRRRKRMEAVLFEGRDEVGGAWAMHQGQKEYLVAGLKSGDVHPKFNGTTASSSVSAGSTNSSPDSYAPPPDLPQAQTVSQIQRVFVYPPSSADPSPMYPGLHTNLPSDLMAFRDLPLPPAEAGGLFPTGERILRYLQDYSAAFGLGRWMRFGARVVRVRRTGRTAEGEGTNEEVDGEKERRGDGTGEKEGEREEPRRWTVTSRDKHTGQETEEMFDFVCVANGHYSDTWIPPIPGLETWTRTLTHSRFYSGPAPYAGQTVLVVGSFASGSDVVRQLATWDLEHAHGGSCGDRIKVYASADYSLSTTLIPRSSSSSSAAEPTDSTSGSGPAWLSHVHSVPLISHISPGSAAEGQTIHFQPFGDGTTHPPVSDADVMIFATGYNYALPFFKRTDEPWASLLGQSKKEGNGVSAHPDEDLQPTGSGARLEINGRPSKESDPPNGAIDPAHGHKEEKDKPVVPLHTVIRPEERQGGGATYEAGGLRGLTMKGLDEFLFFLKGDRSMCFPALPYSIVPFPLAECQARLASLLWAGLIPSFPAHPDVPRLKGNPYWDQADAWPSSPPVPPTVPSPPPGAGPPTPSPPAHIDPPRSYPPPSARKSTSMREKLIFSSPTTPFYEFKYQEYMMALMREADAAEGWETPDHWKRVEELRYERRKGGFELRREVLGY